MLHPASITVTVQPAIEPVTAGEAQTWARAIDPEPTESRLWEDMIADARRRIEAYTGRALITQTIVARYDRFPCAGEALIVPRPPLQSVTWVKYLDSDGVEQTWDSAEYTVDLYSMPARIVPGYDYSWPTPRSVPNAVSLQAVVGFGTAASAVPATYRQALQAVVLALFEDRGTGGTAALDSALDLLWSERISFFA